MRRSFLLRLGLAGVLAAGVANVARAQVSIEEAERRLRARAATRPSTSPVTDMDRLREENRRLRQRVADLQQEVLALKEILSHASAGPTPAPSPTTLPSEAVRQALLGRWRGGDNTAGNVFILEFDSDGSYKQTFIFNNEKFLGQYRLFQESVLEMWGDKTPDDAPHNHYQIALAPGELTMTPVSADGSALKAVHPWILRRTD